MLPDFFFCSIFPVQQTTSGIGYHVKWFFGLATNSLNLRKNNDGVVSQAYRAFCFCVQCPCMAINTVIVQYNGGFLPDVLLLTQAPIISFEITIPNLILNFVSLYHSTVPQCGTLSPKILYN